MFAETSEHVLEGHVLRLLNGGEQCVLERRLQADQTQVQKQTLELRPPCHFMRWSNSPPTMQKKRPSSAGVAVGSKGDPRAWRYPSANNVIVIAVLGDPQNTDPVFLQHAAHSAQCGTSVQAILLAPTEFGLGPLEKNGRVQCAEYGMDEKRFWLWAHPVKK